MKFTSIGKALFMAAAFCVAHQADAQLYSTLWKPVNGPVAAGGEQLLHPSKFATFRTSEQSLLSVLANLPEDAAAAPIIELPTPNGSFRTFRVWKTPMMAPGLAAKYPGITTYTATATDNHMVTAKLDYTQFGFHAMIFDGNDVVFIDPYSNVADGNYMSYYKSDYPRPAGKEMHCEVDTRKDAEMHIGEPDVLNRSGLPQLAYRVNGTTKRKYRLAVACTGEYAVAVNGATPTKAGVLARIVTSVNRVNGVYERELSYTMELINENDTLINLDAATDPYTNNSGGTMLGQNQTALTQRIGGGAYDMGHVFSTGGGGIATKGSVCSSFSKAQGVTGSTNPVGDAFDIDYVAHEMGHQFGADHTFNNNTSGSCSGNAVSSQAYEPGSGSTLMAYAGICGGGNDYTNHSTVYFHSASLEQITTYIGSTNCAVTSASANQNATLPAFTATYAIPFLTPFELIAPEASDNTADSITYIWEERDRGDFGKTLATTRLAGPMFRPFVPVQSRIRIFPQIDSLLRNRFSYSGEKLPDTARKLAFRLTQRDIYQGFGCWNFPNDSIRLNVIYTGTPFKVTTPSASTVWQANTSNVVTWDVSSTDQAPISCATVDIFLSTDGGYTFPYTLATGTANDGSEAVNIPNVNSTKMRVKVKGVGNVFFSISGANAKVQGGVGVGKVTFNPEVIISPIPASTSVQVKISNTTESLQARILNAVGQEVWHSSIREQGNIAVSGWAKGIYYMHLTNASGNVNMNKTIVVQ